MSITTHRPAAIRTLGIAIVLSLALACAVLAGCGPASIATSHAPSSTATATATPTAATTQTCLSSQLALAQDHSGVALGHVAVVLRLDNRGSYTCALEGYPSIELLDATQRPLPTQQHRTTMAYTFTVSAPQPVVLAVGASAYFHLEWSDIAPSGQSCSYNAAYLQVTPPQNQMSLLLQLAVGACAGNIITSPLEPSAG